jgi:CBS domain containing-hemolysin-like protein
MSGVDFAMLAVVLLMTLTAAVLALAETSITRMSKARAAALAQTEPRKGARVQRIVDNLERDLNSIYLSVNIVQTIQAALVGVLAANLFGAAGVAVGIVVNVVVLFVVAEAAPKTWALQHTERAALLTAPVVEFAGWVLRLPARALIGAANIILPGKGLRKGPFVTEEEILALAEEAMEHSVIEESERDLIESIIDFGDTVAREIMVPRTDMVTIGAGATIAEVVDMSIEKGLSRIPVYGENTDDIEGIVYVKDAMRTEREGGGGRAVAELAHPALFVPETKRVAELLAEMQAQRTHMAIVVDEYGGTAGLVTLEDLLEELVGEIRDEFDVELPAVETLPNGDVLVNASLNVDDVNGELDLELPEGNYDSLGGLVFELLGRVPVAGDSVECEGVRLIVERVDGRRVVRVRLVRMEPAEMTEADEPA